MKFKIYCEDYNPTKEEIKKICIEAYEENKELVKNGD